MTLVLHADIWLCLNISHIPPKNNTIQIENKQTIKKLFIQFEFEVILVEVFFFLNFLTALIVVCNLVLHYIELESGN